MVHDADTHEEPVPNLRQAVEAIIAQNKAELEKMKADVWTLENREYELLGVLNTTSPIMSTLSPEILSEIFLVVCADELGTYRVPRQFFLGRVCRAWRRIAWSTPRLWSRVGISFSKERYNTQMVLLEEWIKRSGDCPLELSLQGSYNEKWDLSIDSALKFLMGTCHRWTKLKIWVFPGMALALEHHRPQFPLLHTLDIDTGRIVGDRYLAKWNFHSATPQLRSLDVINFIPGPKLGVNWEALVELRTTLNVGFRPSIELLALLPSLECLNCSLEGYRSNLNVNDYPIPNLRSLSSLSVDGHPKMVVSLLQYITTPKLHKLQINFAPFATQVSWPTAIVDLTQRSACLLNELILSQSDVTDEGVILDMLGKISHPLKEFRLYCPATYTMSNQTINRLNLSLQRNKSRQQECLPNLETFAFRGNVSFTLRAMRRMLRSRRRHCGNPLDLEGETDSEEEDEDEDFSSSSEDEDKADGGSTPSMQSNKCDDHSHTSEKKLSIDITYLNLSWYQMKNPNKMWDFTNKARDYASKGISLCLEWEKPESDARMSGRTR